VLKGGVGRRRFAPFRHSHPAWRQDVFVNVLNITS